MFGLSEKARENKGERKMGGKCYFPLFGSVEKTKRRENRGENKSLGPKKYSSPQIRKKTEERKSSYLEMTHIPP